MFGGGGSQLLDGNNSKLSSFRPNSSSLFSSTLSSTTASNRNKFASVPLIRKDVIKLDTKSVVRMHYGMNITLMNSLQEVVCVNEFNYVYCKPLDLLDRYDMHTFKIIDINDISYPGPVEYGKPIWLLVQPNQDNQSVGSSGSNINGGDSGGVNVQQQANAPSTVLTSKLFQPPEMASSEKNNTASNNSINIGAVKAKSKKANDICGMLSTVKMYETVHAKHGESEAQQTNESLRMKSKPAIHLGKWVVQTALRDELPADNFVTSCTGIYLEQDLYCLSTSHGNVVNSWPWITPSVGHLANVAGKFFSDAPTNHTPTAANGLTHTNSFSGNAQVGIASLSLANRAEVHLNSVKTNPRVSHGCLRKVVKRGLPYELLVDRRCVWNLVVADDLRNMNSLSMKEQKAQKLVRRALIGLENSQKLRQGGIEYDGFSLNGAPLKSGEKFPSTLRKIFSEQSFNSEQKECASRRLVEENKYSYFKEKFYKHASIRDDICSVSNGHLDEQLSISSLGDYTAGFHDNHSMSVVSKNSNNLQRKSTPIMTPIVPKNNNNTELLVDDVESVLSNIPDDIKKSLIDPYPSKLTPSSFGSDLLSTHHTFNSIHSKVTVLHTLLHTFALFLFY